MSDIVFECSYCQQSLVVDAAGVGVEIDCPGCGNSIVIPAGVPSELETLTVVEDVGLLEVSRKDASSDSRNLRFRELLDESARAILPKLEMASLAIRRSLDQR
jgi:hypothetical protein